MEIPCFLSFLFLFGWIGNSGQQLAQQMQAQNPELVEQLRRQMGGGPGSNDPGSEPGSNADWIDWLVSSDLFSLFLYSPPPHLSCLRFIEDCVVPFSSLIHKFWFNFYVDTLFATTSKHAYYIFNLFVLTLPSPPIISLSATTLETLNGFMYFHKTRGFKQKQNTHIIRQRETSIKH
jgi:hypothetical protein